MTHPKTSLQEQEAQKGAKHTLRSIRDLSGYRVRALDGEIGKAAILLRSHSHIVSLTKDGNLTPAEISP